MTRKTTTITAVALALFGLGVLARPEGRALQASSQAPKVPSVRLYVLDCGVLKRGEPTGYGLTRARWGPPIFQIPVTWSSIREAHCCGTSASFPTTTSGPAAWRSGRAWNQYRDAGHCAVNCSRSGTPRRTSPISRSLTDTPITSPMQTSTRIDAADSARRVGLHLRREAAQAAVLPHLQRAEEQQDHPTRAATTTCSAMERSS